MNDSGSPKSDALEAGDRYRRLRRGLSGGNDRKRRRFQFSLRTLLLFVLVSSVGFSWLGTRLHRAEKNREAEAEIQKVAIEIGDLGAAVRVEQEARSWLENLLDDPGVKSIAVVDFNSPYDFGGTIDPQSLPRRQVTDTDLGQMVHASLKRLTDLRALSLSNTQVTDVGLRHLTRLTKLEELYIANTQISDTGLEHRKGLTNLGLLDLYGTQVTDEGVQKFKQVLPNCEIHR